MTPTFPPAITARITKTHLKLLRLVTTTLQSTALPLATHTPQHTIPLQRLLTSVKKFTKPIHKLIKICFNAQHMPQINFESDFGNLGKACQLVMPTTHAPPTTDTHFQKYTAPHTDPTPTIAVGPTERL